MLQDIEPHQFRNEFVNRKLGMEDYILVFQENRLLLREMNSEIMIPRVMDFGDLYFDLQRYSQYLFSVDGENYFLIQDFEFAHINGWEYVDTGLIRHMDPKWKVFLCSAGAQLNRWYDGNRICGHCGHPMMRSDKERALCCTDCKRVIYPSLSPAVIVGVINQDRILLTRYARGAYRKYSLVAGYVEVGESLEKTVAREVMEEVGLRVKNIRYYKSQPWPFTDALLVGFFAELDGPDTIRLEEEELCEATWYARPDIPCTEGSLSLTNEMIEYFRNHS